MDLRSTFLPSLHPLLLPVLRPPPSCPQQEAKQLSWCTHGRQASWVGGGVGAALPLFTTHSQVARDT
ncbi:hypothetical protein E2C01_041196 [Portunus trituberculatus]|uniref:Uncharacterized protein n=1 Tax=Portunus trituberculatus TaxID=210409 RepID=A0A5B7FQA3_PORTR|nr:hypothetical protein [Portunus trituberculatus]